MKSAYVNATIADEPKHVSPTQAIWAANERLNALVDRLAIRLEPVLVPAQPTPAKGDSTGGLAISPLMAELRDAANRLDSNLDYLLEIIERVDL